MPSSAFNIEEYKGKKKRTDYRKRKFPLIRLILLLILGIVGIRLGWGSRIASLLPLPEEQVKSYKAWEKVCLESHGKTFELKHKMAQCSWLLGDTAVSLPSDFLRYIASNRKDPQAKLHWVAPIDDFQNPTLVQIEDSVTSSFFHMYREDSSMVWVDFRTGCRYPGLCPQKPMQWSLLPISENFDFEGQESLLAMDVFRGLGEAPIYPVLGGVVLSAATDSSGFFVEIDHGNNVTSKTSGIRPYDPPVSVGDTVHPETPIGRLAPLDSAIFFLAVRRNGAFVRWNDFYKAAHPVSESEIAIFQKKLGF